ncbi:DUF2270 domain-containing protein [Methylobacterium oxalidis]|uniref:Membrane protein n=1 Tax=Methylobacterium oxalidis TaxID=944322 RepID=A0A512J5F9_9HYPH|nr:DUF2270 domain-containing protein [Methylobacterium oxalidis]GEP05211.1 membrane protein [Methylobacterium oxalidis]GJE34211.1 hypothetical protein LDDCCGHA_4418 [Methylobacterium oxalidis]GLS66371.1 membrane protein [Methylobacterium oxalidis]
MSRAPLPEPIPGPHHEGPPGPVPQPRGSGEIITVLAHYHRGEIGRMAGWRDRIDRTTNWSITVIAAMLSVSLSTPTAHHGVLLFAMLLVLLLLAIEARRYRFFDVYRARVRRLERHYYAQVFAPLPGGEADWSRDLGESLRRPVFRISLADALARRLRRNYGWMFLILLLAWTLKITSPRLQPGSPAGEADVALDGVLAHAALGPMPGWLVIGLVAAFYAGLLTIVLRSIRRERERDDGPVHV